MNYNNLEKLGIKLSKSESGCFENFIKLFFDYNSQINLISANDSKYLFEKHIYDSLAFNLFYKKYCTQKMYKLLDIGTGGGFPAIPISMKYKNINVTAVDSIRKKINVIDTMSSQIGLDNLQTMCTRIENMDNNLKEGFDIVTSRAMARLNIILEYGIPYLKEGGYFIAYKSVKADEEIEEAENALKILGSEIVDKIEYTLPINEENKRFLIIVKKINKTKNIYPRQNTLIVKNPL